ncbi:MAG TPA: methyl-accepting chemotaxis protein [Bryobacteraceae bacterium]|nr:methyl-accepting chemotaxis protein [Bryobacteraceae bacterium]
MKIGPRLLFGFGVTVALTLLLGGYTLRKQAELQKLTDEVDRRDFASLQSLEEITSGANNMRGQRELALLNAYLHRDHLAAGSPQADETMWRQLRETDLKALSDLAVLAGQFETSAVTVDRSAGWRRMRVSIQDCEDALNALTPAAETEFTAINNGNLQDGGAALVNAESLSTAYAAKLNTAQRVVQDQLDLGRSEVDQSAANTRESVVVVLIVTVLVGFFFAMIIHRSITAPLQDFMQVVERVGRGDLTRTVPLARRDEIGDLGKGLDRMVKGLKAVASQTRLVAESINSATTEILASTQQQAAATAEQAAAVHEANATMAEISQSGAQISERAKQVATAAEATSTASTSGLQSVKATTAIMEAIRQQAEAVAENVIALSEKTQAIGDIITTVNDIAEQSHLLALNASIQAAAAGEHGRSFSVVAREMKNLAVQSKQATVQVRGILGDIQRGITSSVMLTEEAVKRADSGRQQVGLTDDIIRKLTENIEESIRAFQQIVGGSSQQQIGFEQVTHAFRNIGVATQQTASSTRQSEKAAANLSDLAKDLREAVARYQL